MANFHLDPKLACCCCCCCLGAFLFITQTEATSISRLQEGCFITWFIVCTLPSTMALCQDNTIIVVILVRMMSALSPSCRGCSPNSLPMSGYLNACNCCTRDCWIERENLQCCGEFVLTAHSMWPIGVVHTSQSTGNMLIRQSDLITHANENLSWAIGSWAIGTR